MKSYHFGIELQVACVQLECNVLGEQEVPQYTNTGNALAKHSSQCTAHNAPSENQHKQVVQNDARKRADNHGKQGAVWCACRTDEVVYAHADNLEDNAESDDLDERVRVIVDFRRSAGKREERLHAGRNAGDYSHHNRNDDSKTHRIAKALFSSLLVAFAQTQCGKRVAAIADEHAQRHEDRHQRHGGSCYRKANLAHGLAKEDGVNYVVGTVNQHAHNRGNGEFQHQFRNGTRSIRAVRSLPLAVAPPATCLRIVPSSKCAP